MILLFTDFGSGGPYSGQMKAILARQAPAVPVIDLFSDAPAFDPKLSAYLLAAYTGICEPGDVLLCVVDPGVGSDRRPVVVEVDGLSLVGPDNGLFSQVARRGWQVNAWRIDWRPPDLSATFHGRDLFAPVAARLARGELPAGSHIPPAEVDRPDWPDDLPLIVYVDGYGNALTGLRASGVSPRTVLLAGRHRIRHARTFGEVPPGTPLWHSNANGLVEVAVNQGRADRQLGLALGDSVVLLEDG